MLCRTTVLFLIRQVTAALSLAAVTFRKVSTSGRANGSLENAFASNVPETVVMVVRMMPSTTSGVGPRRRLKVAVPESTSTVAASVATRIPSGSAAKATGNSATRVSSGPTCDCSVRSEKPSTYG